jgi:hypothetical protein
VGATVWWARGTLAPDRTWLLCRDGGEEDDLATPLGLDNFARLDQFPCCLFDIPSLDIATQPGHNIRNRCTAALQLEDGALCLFYPGIDNP